MPLPKKNLPPILLGLLLVAYIVYLPKHDTHPAYELLQRLESMAYDLRLRLTMDTKPALDERVVIVAVDEFSLAEVGRWPWPRHKVAAFTEKLFEHGAAVVGFDMIFSEPQRNSALALLNGLEELNQDDPKLQQSLTALNARFDYDAILANSLRDKEAVLGYLFHSDTASNQAPLPTPLATQANLDWNIGTITDLPSYTTNLPLLQSAAMGNAFMTTLRDDDGILRRSPLLLRYGDNLYGSLSLELAKLFFILDEIEINTAEIGDRRLPESLSLGSVTVPIDKHGRAIIPYRGPSPAFPYVSAADLLADRVDPTLFENKIVLVGATALGIGDVVATPVQNAYPGVEVHASLVSGMLSENLPTTPAWAEGANMVMSGVIGIVLVALLPWLSALPLLMVGLVISTVLVGGNIWFWHDQHLALNLAQPLTLVVILTGFYLFMGYFNETHERARLKKMFGQYVPPQLVDIMTQHPEQISDAGESREMTVLFADIRSFTTLSETLAPDELKRLLNHFFTEMTGIIFAQKGTIDKYVGDMIMAFWGAPLNDPHHANHAVSAALAMLAAVENLNPKLEQLNLPTINIGIGLNTGIMNVGDMGSEFRRAYTVIGDAVNLGSRLEGLTKYYGVGLVIGEETYQRLDNIICRRLDRVQVKGKTSAVEVYQPVCHTDEQDDALAEELASYHQALKHYWQQQWDAAQVLLLALQQQHPNTHVYSLYLERVEELRHQDLGPDWQGVYERSTK